MVAVGAQQGRTAAFAHGEQGKSEHQIDGCRGGRDRQPEAQILDFTPKIICRTAS